MITWLTVFCFSLSGGRWYLWRGDLPRRMNEIPAGLMDGGQRPAALVVAVDRNAPPWEMVEMEVVMDGGGEL